MVTSRAALLLASLFAAAPLLAAPAKTTAAPKAAAPAAPPKTTVTPAAPATPPAQPQQLPQFEIALKAGGHFPEVWNKLGPSYDLVLKAGWAPLEDRRLQTFVELGYSQPSKTSSGFDPRLGAGGANYSTNLSVRDLSTRVGAQWSFIGSLPVTPYAGAALRLDFVKSVVTGSAAGVPFDEYRETGTQFGGMVFGGVAYRLWRGELLGEVAFSYTPIRQRVTDKANIASTSLLLGYGFWL